MILKYVRHCEFTIEICRLEFSNPSGKDCKPTTLPRLASRQSKFVIRLSSGCHLAVQNQRTDLHPCSMVCPDQPPDTGPDALCLSDEVLHRGLYLRSLQQSANGLLQPAIIADDAKRHGIKIVSSTYSGRLGSACSKRWAAKVERGAPRVFCRSYAL
jgi:hypothetical protein